MRFVALVVFLFTSLAFAQDKPEDKLGLHNQSEVGYIVVGGNTKSQSFSGKQTSTYQFTDDLLKLNGHYLNARALNQQTREVQGTAENWSGNLRWEHTFVPDRFNGFTQAGVRGDRFIGVDFGQAYDIGGKYFIISAEKLKWFTELGYQYLKEDYKDDHNPATPAYREAHFIRLYSQVDYEFKPTIKFGFWAEYLPDLKNNENYRINFSPYMLAILTDTFSLKFGFEGYYRNLPVAPNTIRFDYRHVTSLVANF